MAFSNSTSDRMDELRFRQSVRGSISGGVSGSEQPLLGLVSPPRNGGSRLPPPLSASASAQDGRGFTLTRRFTTDSGRVPTLHSITGQRGVQDGQEYVPSNYHKVQLLEKKKLEYERLREQKRRFEAEMQILDLQQRQEEQELRQMQEDLGRHHNSHNTNGGHQSEPTTPPEYRETSSGFPTVFSRPNRYSTSSLTSPIGGLYNRPGRSASQLTSPHNGLISSRYTMDENAIIMSNSGSASRRNSEDDDKEQAVRQDPSSHRSSNHQNRYSMPVTKSRNGIQDMLSLDQTNTTRFLFGDEDAGGPMDSKNYLQMHATDENFPILVRGEHPQNLSTSSAALDLASGQSTTTESSGWSSFGRHRAGQQSLPTNHISQTSSSQNGNSSNMNGSTSQNSTPLESPLKVRTPNRYSQDLKYFGDQDKSQVTSPTSQVQMTPPKLQTSYSANDVPTMKSNGGNAVGSTPQKPQSHAQQHFHNHNASLGRIPPNAVNNRQGREVNSGESTPVREATNGGYQSIQSALQASAPPFGPSVTQSSVPLNQPAVTQAGANPYGMQNYYNNYNMPMMAMAMQNMQIGQQAYPQSAYGDYGVPPAYQNNAPRDSQARVIQQRRQNDGEAMNRFANVALESLGGEIYSLCKDQHGCRFLQKKLEERNAEQIHMIWLETNQHVVELMTDPFGNYLCQKLLEFCNDEERTVLIENASQDLVRIALNQHGTRALQKMIEFISTAGQIQTIIEALRYQVVELIQDLNGNHVIQKCLNKLSPLDAQFIFDAVGRHCVDVGTHRHGCCVLQRCIDHASGEQKAWLIRQISNNAFTLVQDPFGNYVVQYILDLNEPVFTEPLVAMFAGRVGQLSRQKFSSNVIEKCLRCAQEPSKDMLIEEMLATPADLERLLRDSFANYVVQTALDYANPAMKTRLVDAIRPILPQIRTTPYGRRIQAKLQGAEGRPAIATNGASTGAAQITETAAQQQQLPLRQLHARSLSNASATAFANGNAVGAYGSAGFVPSTRAPVTVFPSSTQIATAGISAQGYAGPPPPPQQQGNGYPYGRGNGAQAAQVAQAPQQPQQQQGGQQQQGNYF
ncbi:hypothetical protein VE00_08460 [Pseudogymnoascus sp. WSF 3629]|nr:hypothetical protein VE00_08460 [Pseudogymnoascus sp. WSF 3629]